MPKTPAAADVKGTAEPGRQWKPQASEHGKQADSSEDGGSAFRCVRETYSFDPSGAF